MIRLYNSADPKRLFEDALRLPRTEHPYYSGIIYIAPSNLRARHAERIFHRIINPEKRTDICYIPPDITTLNELSKRLYSTYSLKTLLSRPLTPILIALLSDKGLGLSIIVSDLIKDLKQFHPDRDTGELKEQVIKILESYNLPDSLKATIIGSLETFNLYQECLNMNNLIDEDDLLKLCSHYIKEWRVFNVSIIDGFYAPTRAEMFIIKTIIGKSDHSLISVPRLDGLDEVTNDYVSFLKNNFSPEYMDVSPKGCKSDFRYIAYEDIESEVEGIARNIKSLFISGKIKDLSEVVVAFPKLNKYREIIERVFYRYGIPCDISQKRPLGQTRAMIDLFCMIQSIYEDYPRLKFSQFLSSRYFKKIPESIKSWIPNLSLQSGIITGKKAWLNFLSRGNERCNINDIIENTSRSAENNTLFTALDQTLISGLTEIERDILEIFRKLEPIEEIKASASFSEFSTRLKTILKELGFLDVTYVDEDYRIFSDMKKHLLNCLDELASLERIKPARLSLQEFSEYLWYILDHIYVDREVEGVTVTDIHEASPMAFLRHIYVGGLTDDDMPDRGSIDYILPDSVKRAIGLPDLDKRITLQKFLLENIIRSSAHVHLSYPLSEGEDKFLPSPFLYSGQQERERIPGIFSKEEILVMKGERPLSKFLREIKINSKISNLTGMLNVTDIDSYRSCPRRFFIEKLLRVLHPTIKEYDLEATILGEIIHKVMERIIFESLDNVDKLKEKAAEMVDRIADSRNIDQFWKDIIKDAFIEILPDIISKEMEIRRDGYTPYKVEQFVTGEPLKGIRFKGKIDRIDRSESGVTIIDYKTGSDTLTCSKVYHGKEKLQLFLYAALLKTQGYRVERVGIYSLKDITIKWCPPRKKGRGKTVDIDDMITASLRFLEETVEEFRKGIFTAKPLDDNYYICRKCGENPFCPYIQS